MPINAYEVKPLTSINLLVQMTQRFSYNIMCDDTVKMRDKMLLSMLAKVEKRWQNKNPIANVPATLE